MNAFNDKRFWVGGGVLAAVLLVAASWLFAISPKLSDASSLRDSAASAEAQNSVLQAKVARLKKQNENKDQLTASLWDALAALPLDSGLPDFTRQLTQQAAASGVNLTSISVGAMTLVASSAATTTGQAAGQAFSIPVTIAAAGSMKQQLAFLKAVQFDGPRRALVTGTQFGPGVGATSASIDAASSMTVMLNVFSSPKSAATEAQLKQQLSSVTPS